MSDSRRLLVAMVLSLMAVSLRLHAADENITGPHGGSLVFDKDSQFEVKLDRSARKVEVYLLKFNLGLPEKMTLSLTSEMGAGPLLELDRVKLVSGAPVYRSALPDWRTSYVGVVLQVPWGRGKTKTLKSSLPKVSP